MENEWPGCPYQANCRLGGDADCHYNKWLDCEPRQQRDDREWEAYYQSETLAGREPV